MSEEITILVGIITIIGVYMFFRTESIKDLLIGQGQATLNKQRLYRTNNLEPIAVDKPNEYSDITLSDIMFWQLSDAIDRKNIYGVQKVLKHLAIIEVQNNSCSTTGYKKHVYPQFLKTITHLNRVKYVGFTIIALSFIKIITIITLSKIPEYLATHPSINYLLQASTAFITIAILIASAVYMCWTIFATVGFERVKKREFKGF